MRGMGRTAPGRLLCTRIAPAALASACRYDCGRLELDLARAVEQVGYENHAHARVMPSHQALPDRAELRARREIGRLVAAKRCNAADVFGTTSGLGQHRQHVLQRLIELRRDFGGVKALL